MTAATEDAAAGAAQRRGGALRGLRARLQGGPPRWLPALAVVTVVAACVALGRVPVWPQADVVLAAGLLVVAALSPPLGLVALTACVLASPLALATGTHTTLPAALLAVPLLSLLWGIEACARRDLGVLRLPAVQAAAALALAAVLAAAIGNLPGMGFGITAPLGAQLGGVGVFVLSAAAFVLAADQLGDVRWLRRVTWVYLAFTGLLIGGRVIPELGDPGAWLLQGGASGSLTWTWFAAVAAAQAAFNRQLHWRVRLLLGLAVFGELCFGIVAGRTWLAGWAPPLIAVTAVLCLGAPRLGLPLVALGGVAVAFNAPRVLAGLMAGDNQYSLETRVEAWRILARIVAADPVFGLGPANYYHVTPQFPIRGYFVNFSSHNTFVDVVAQTGAVGLACFAWWLWATLRAGWRVRNLVPAGFARAYVLGALGGLAGTVAAAGLGDWVLPFVYNVTLAGLRASLPAWVLLGGLVALSRTVDDRAAVPAGAATRVWSTRRVLLGIIAVAVLLRIAVALALGDSAVPISGAADQVSYDALAQRLLAGHGFSFATHWYPFTEANEPTAHWSYLYTLYLAAVYAVGGHHPLTARLVQALASGLSCWLIFRIGRGLFDERTGLVAAALTAVYGYFVFFNAALMTQTFFILALLLAMDRALAIAVRPTAGAWAGLGLSLGVGALLRQTLLPFTPLLLAWLLWSVPDRRRWRHALGAAALLTFCVAPWTIYNYTVFGDFLLLNSNGGYFFYAANHPDQGTDFDPTATPPPPERLRGLSEPALDRALFRTALGFIAADPVRFLRLSWSRAGVYFWLLPSAASSSIANMTRLCSFTLYLPFMLYGLLLSCRRARLCVPLYLYLLFDTVLHLTSWSAPRYRLPSDALLMVFAALAVVDLAERVGILSSRRVAAGGGANASLA